MLMIPSPVLVMPTLTLVQRLADPLLHSGAGADADCGVDDGGATPGGRVGCHWSLNPDDLEPSWS